MFWPRAVAVSTADIQPSGHDQTLLISSDPRSIDGAVLRAEAGEYKLISVDGFCESAPYGTKIIGVLPKPMGQTCDH